MSSSTYQGIEEEMLIIALHFYNLTAELDSVGIQDLTSRNDWLVTLCINLRQSLAKWVTSEVTYRTDFFFNFYLFHTITVSLNYTEC